MITSTEPIEIPLSKRKMILMLSGCLAFVVIGFWFVTAPPAIENSYWGDPVRITVIGYAAIIMFGLCAVLLIRKLPGRKPGLIIDQEGLEDHSGLSTGKIRWSDIDRISVVEIYNQKLIMIQVYNPSAYIDAQTNLFKRKSMELNYKMYGTPLSITANALQISFPELLSILSSRLKEAKASLGESANV